MHHILRASQVHPATKGSVAFRIVLAHRQEEHQPFVTWEQYFPEGRPPHFGTGHYIDSPHEAHDDFFKRCARWGLAEDFSNRVTEDPQVAALIQTAKRLTESCINQGLCTFDARPVVEIIERLTGEVLEHHPHYLNSGLVRWQKPEPVMVPVPEDRTHFYVNSRVVGGCAICGKSKAEHEPVEEVVGLRGHIPNDIG